MRSRAGIIPVQCCIHTRNGPMKRSEDTIELCWKILFMMDLKFTFNMICISSRLILWALIIFEASVCLMIDILNYNVQYMHTFSLFPIMYNVLNMNNHWLWACMYMWHLCVDYCTVYNGYCGFTGGQYIADRWWRRQVRLVNDPALLVHVQYNRKFSAEFKTQSSNFYRI